MLHILTVGATTVLESRLLYVLEAFTSGSVFLAQRGEFSL